MCNVFQFGSEEIFVTIRVLTEVLNRIEISLKEVVRLTEGANSIITFRRLLLANGTCSHKLSKFLVSILNPLLVNPFMISNTLSFLDDLRSLDVDLDKVFMASPDIKSLFNNVPLDKTINIVINKAFVDSSPYYGFIASHLRKF